jgi:CRP/FNR family cyclic AMP-dependent transcriptional regulator
VSKKKEKESDAAVLARLRKELAKPHLTKSVRENATKKQIASWNAGQLNFDKGVRKLSRHLNRVFEAAMTRRQQRSFQPAMFLSKMGAKSVIALFRGGQAICSQGDAGKEVFYIEKGQVKLTVKSKRGKETVLAILHRGDYLGAGCMTGQAFRTATATALTRSTILIIEKKEMMRALHNGHEFSDHFIGCLLGRNIRIEEDLIDQHLCSCEERLARALLLIARYDKIRKPTAVIPKINHGTLGGLIGSTRSRVCYFMNKFKKLGYIEYGERLRVHNSSLSGVLKDSIFSDLHASRPN